MVTRTIVEDRPGGHIISEANYAFSREQIVLDVTAVAIPSGTALAKLTATGLYVPYNPANTANYSGVAFLWERREISAATQRATAHVRNCEVNGREASYLNALNAGQQTAFEATAAGQDILVRY
jgi:hypothetical protein